MVACSSSSSSGSVDSDAGKSDAATATDAAAATDSPSTPTGDAATADTGASTTAITGTVNGTSFAAASGFFFVDDTGKLDLIFSDKFGICDSAKQSKIHAGETMVQLYTLAGTAPGVFTSANGDVKYATVKPTCASDAPLGDSEVAAASRATTSTVTLSVVTSTKVEGTLDITFEDGSKVSGGFSVSACSVTIPESSTCY